MKEKETPENQQQNYLNKAETDFRDKIVSILAMAGYYPEVNERRIDFNYRGDTIIVFIDNPYELHADYPFFSYDKEEKFYIMDYVNVLNWRYIYSRFLITNDNVVVARACYPVNKTTNVADSFWNVINNVLTSAARFRNDFKQNNNQLIEQ